MNTSHCDGTRGRKGAFLGRLRIFSTRGEAKIPCKKSLAHPGKRRKGRKSVSSAPSVRKKEKKKKIGATISSGGEKSRLYGKKIGLESISQGRLANEEGRKEAVVSSRKAHPAIRPLSAALFFPRKPLERGEVEPLQGEDGSSPLLGRNAIAGGRSRCRPQGRKEVVLLQFRSRRSRG